jgi:inorganic pyrophosphatase
VDVLVVTPFPLQPGVVIRCRPVGVLKMEDDGGVDAKVVAVPVSKLTPLYDKVQTTDDLPELLMRQTVHFFEHYKDLEPGKWVKILGWGTVEEAKQEIVNGLAAAQK